MKVVLEVGPRNEEMIAQVKEIMNCSFSCPGFEKGFDGETEESIALYQRIALDELAEACDLKDELLDAIYYACGEREDELKERESYFQDQMCGDEFSYSCIYKWCDGRKNGCVNTMYHSMSKTIALFLSQKI